MVYKVTFIRLLILKDGSIGNTSQGTSHIFTDYPIEQISIQLNDLLKPKRESARIIKLEEVGGLILKKSENE